jgi:hypothetical protein
VSGQAEGQKRKQLPLEEQEVFMKSSTGVVRAIVFVFMLFFGVQCPNNATAWYLELTNVDGTLAGTELYGMDLLYQGGPSDLLNDLSVNVSYDTSKLDYVGIEYSTWFDSGSQKKIWSDFIDPDLRTPGFLGTIFSGENIDNQDMYYPMGTAKPSISGNPVTPANHIATLSFTAKISGTYSDLAAFVFDPGPLFVTQVTKDNIAFKDADLVIEKMGTSSTLGTPSPVPVPGALWLLVSGLPFLLKVSRGKREACRGPVLNTGLR